MPLVSKGENINSSYFNGFYKDIWRSFIPDKFTEKEIEFMLGYFNLGTGSKVLDIMCGYGRHAIGLARSGIKVTAVDNLVEYIDEIKQISINENLDLTSVCEDIIQYKPVEKFDLVICMGNSLNFFDQEETEILLSRISSQLNPGGFFFFNTWSLEEIVVRNFQEKSLSKVGDFTFLTECKYLFHPARIEMDSTITSPDGTIENKKGVDYIFSVNEMENMLARSGLYLKENFSTPGKKKFSIGDVRAYIIAGKA